jgi:uncharacterized protein YjbI with pentapeptide repeats
MKVIKPLKLGMLHRTFERDGKAYLVVSGILGFPFATPKRVLSETEIWKTVAEVLMSENGVLDEGNLKPCGEVLVAGSCYASDGAPVAVSAVRVQLGTVDKRLAVFGNRKWKLGVPTAPEPFLSMPIDWQHAFGGTGHAANPYGIGLASIETSEGAVHPLANVEDPKRLVVAPGDRPAPSSFGAMDLTFPQRMALAGTYDRAWLENGFPGLAADLDPAFFCAAPADQRVSGFFAGDETFVVENMHPAKKRQEGALPNGTLRLFVQQRSKEKELVEVPTKLDTVRLFPAVERGVLIFRGVIQVEEDDAADVIAILAAVDDRAAPRPASHFIEVFEARSTKGKNATLALRDEDLMPPAELGWEPRLDLKTLGGDFRPSDAGWRNAEQRRKKEMAAARDKLIAKGLDPKDYALDDRPEPTMPSDPDDLEGLLAYADKMRDDLEKRKSELETKRAEIEAESRVVYAAQGRDYDKEVEKARLENTGPPKFRASEQRRWLRDMLKIARDAGQPMLEMEALESDPAYERALSEQERGMLEQYKQNAHQQDPAPPADIETSERVRAELVVAHHNKLSLLGRDFTGCDLSDLDLAGLDLGGALLESTVLTRTNLAGANLGGAVLAHARLDRTRLGGANLVGANLGGATLDDTDLAGADLSEATLSRAKVRAIDVRGALFRRTNFMDVAWEATPNFSGAKLEDIAFLRVDLARGRFAGANLRSCVFVEGDAEEIDFEGAGLERVTFFKINAARSNFKRARLIRATFVECPSLEASDFTDASADGITLRGQHLEGASFKGAELRRADLSEAHLGGADLSRMVAREGLFIRTDFSGAKLQHADLLGALLSKANLRGADLTGANLFRADLSRVHVDGATKLDRANMTQARQQPRARDGSR